MSIRIFIVISAIGYGVGQYLVLSFIMHRNKQMIKETSRWFVLTQRVVMISQCVLSALLVSVISIMIFVSHYYTSQLILSTIISYVMSIFLLSLLSNRFFSWYKSSNRNLVVLSYGVACAILTVNLALGVAFMTSALLDQGSRGGATYWH